MLRPRRPSAGTLIGLLALFVALGGPAEAKKLLISGKNVKRGTLNGRHVKDRSLGAKELTKAAVAQLTATADGSITAAKLADGAVTTAKIAADAVGGGHVADGSLGGADLAADSITSSKILNGTLTAQDVGGFAGTLTIDFPAIPVGACAFQDVAVTPLANTTPPRSIADDVVVVTPPASFPDDKLVLSAAPQSSTTLRVRICNAFGAGAVDVTSLTFRYISFDL